MTPVQWMGVCMVVFGLAWLGGVANGQASYRKRDHRRYGPRRICADQAVSFEKPYEVGAPSFRSHDDALRPPSLPYDWSVT